MTVAHRFLAILLLTLLSTTDSYAGFEWIPQKQVTAPVEKAPIRRAPVIPTEVEPVQMDKTVLPLPVMEEEPIAVVQDTPVKAPTRLVMTPKEQPNSGVVVHNHDTESLPPLEPVHIPAKPDQAEVMAPKKAMQDDLTKPPFDVSSTAQTTRIIVAEDAPEAAIKQAVKVDIIPHPVASNAPEQAVMTKPKPIMDTPNVAASESAAFDVVEGFAKDVPLALALRQVVPASYAFSFEDNVNPGSRVAWNGGKPWNEIVKEIANSLDYGVKISGKHIRIISQKMSQAEAMIEPAAGDAETLVTAELPQEEPATIEIRASEELSGLEAIAVEESAEISAELEEATEQVVEVSRERDIKRINVQDPGQTSVVSIN